MTSRLVWHCRHGGSRKFYALSLERDLWGNRAIVRRWGRLDGPQAGVLIDWDSELRFDEVARATHQRRRWHKYELVADPNRTLS